MMRYSLWRKSSQPIDIKYIEFALISVLSMRTNTRTSP